MPLLQHLFFKHVKGVPKDDQVTRGGLLRDNSSAEVIFPTHLSSAKFAPDYHFAIRHVPRKGTLDDF